MVEDYFHTCRFVKFQGISLNWASNGVCSRFAVNANVCEASLLVDVGKSKRFRIQCIFMGKQRNLRILSKEEMRQILEAAKKDLDHMIVQVTIEHGLRNSETLSLKKKHVNLGTRRLEIIGSKHNKDRQVPIPVEFQTKLAEWIEDLDSDEYLFPSPVTTSHLTPRYFQKKMHKLCLKAELYPSEIHTVQDINAKLDRRQIITPHTLRHTYATRLLRKGTPTHKVKRLLGHESVKTTIDTYEHLSIEDTREHVNETSMIA